MNPAPGSCPSVVIPANVCFFCDIFSHFSRFPPPWESYFPSSLLLPPINFPPPLIRVPASPVHPHIKDWWARRHYIHTCQELQEDRNWPRSGLQRDWNGPLTSVSSLAWWEKQKDIRDGKTEVSCLADEEKLVHLTATLFWLKWAVWIWLNPWFSKALLTYMKTSIKLRKSYIAPVNKRKLKTLFSISPEICKKFPTYCNLFLCK